MEKNHISDLLPDYLDKALSQKERKAVELHLEACSSCRKELEELSVLFQAMDEDQIKVPTERLRKNFEDFLKMEKKAARKVVAISQERNGSNWASNLLKVAASIALLIASFQMGGVFQQRKANENLLALQNESLQMKQTAMLSLMENQSASKRIQGVSYIEEFENPDEAIINALADRFLHDENDNVRLTAFEALSRFTASETVKNVFIKALENEKNPSIQIAIIQTLVQMQEKKAIAPMKKLLEQEDTQPFIKNQIKEGLPKII
ncbi:HEAT repeat domain-containing protein [Flagellimonas meishanensis]|uniref:HEAT repeat domain-containing protein n=1 Tax=Flagellimonas meishanensis TaxID=2873264 RepID=UPI001CA694E1|nr:HEAT repeat domain-containing protein [[Muricauda] meishanensis]